MTPRTSSRSMHTVVPGSHGRRHAAQGFVATSRGVRVRTDVVADPKAVVAAAIRGCRDGAVLTDVAAARVWSLPLPPWVEWSDAPASVAVPSDGARPKRVGVRGRRLDLPATHLTRLGDLHVTTPARTWLDCCAELPLGHIVAMGDVILRRRLAETPDLANLVRWGVGRRGVVTSRRALPLLDPGAESPGESLARTVLVTGGVRRPICNADVFDRGRWLARADMVWEAERVIVEYDGAVHVTEERRRSDAARRNLLQEAGWYVIVLTARDLKHRGGYLRDRAGGAEQARLVVRTDEWARRGCLQGAGAATTGHSARTTCGAGRGR